MATISYDIEIPEKGLDVLGNIYSPTLEDLRPFTVRDANENEDPLLWNFSKYWHDFVKKTTDDPDIREMLIEDYFSNWRKYEKFRKSGIYHEQKLPFFHNATNSKGLSKRLFGNQNGVNDLLRTDLLGPVGAVIETFEHEIPTGKEITPDNKPSLGLEKGSIRYLSDGTAVDFRKIYPHSYNQIFIPVWISDEVSECIDSEINEKGNYTLNCHIDSESLPVLRYIFEKTAELRERFPARRNQYLNETAIRNEIGFSKSLVRRAVRDSIGVIAEGIIIKHKFRYHRKVFLPKCREELASYLIDDSVEKSGHKLDRDIFDMLGI